ncbi:hypothetical protein M2454_000071 [Aequitasia blattaphilus]|uniref:Uncharacterized protein n=1 Tax=Aequitasia blattaphilus TaxID=2949332 RepID=A0ABT1E542_9FIRM|nr:hypothetical protein [Aequitasia blattaphilus]MCP1100863.1 hypothetical protein [Aequitasia blattaphilus]MCR8613503.1 hypothetical protein [Aequitasia blattaphilus]
MEKRLKIKKSNSCAIILLTICLAIQSTMFGISVKAEGEESPPIPPYTVVYNEELNSVSINFDLETIDQEKYEIAKLVTEGEQRILYDREADIQDLAYEVTTNGEYEFALYYKEKEQPVEGEQIITEEEETERETEENDTQQTLFTIVVEQIKDEEGVNVSEGGEVPFQNIEPIQPTLNEEKPTTQINLTGQFDMAAAATNKKEYATISGNSAKLSDSQIAWSTVEGPFSPHQICQTTSFTSKYKIDFRRSWSLDGMYFQPFVADGFAVSFHNQAGYKSKVENGSGFLGAYGDIGLKTALVFELDSFTFSNRGDVGTEGKKGAHMQIMQANGTAEPDKVSDLIPVASGTYEDPKSAYFGTEQPFSLSYEAASRTIIWKYGGSGKASVKTLSYTFTSESDIIARCGSLTPYYTLSCAMNYSNIVINNHGSANSGNSQLTMNEFKYIDMLPAVTETKYYRIETNGTETTEVPINGDVNRGYCARSGDTIVIRHKLNNTIKSLVDIKDKIYVNTKINDTKLEPISGSAKYYIDPNSKIGLEDAIFNEGGADITYPKNSGAFYVEYQVKIPDYFDSDQVSQLVSEQKLGTNGMTQVVKTQNMPLISRGQLLSNGKSIDNVQCSPLSNSSVNLGITEAQKLFFNNWNINIQGGALTSLKTVSEKFANMVNKSSFVSDSVDNNWKLKVSHFSGGSGTTQIVPNVVDTSKLGMYYSFVEVDEARFKNQNGMENPNGKRNSLRRIWVCDNFVQMNNQYGISKNFTMDEVKLSKLNDVTLKEEILKHIQVYSETASIDEISKLITGNKEGKLESITVDNITVQGITNSSVAGAAGSKDYPSTAKITIHENVFDIPIKVTVVNADVASYIVIPAEIELEKDEGINASCIGRQATIELISEQQSTDKSFRIQADTGFELEDEKKTNKFTVELYDLSRDKLTTKGSVANVGTLNKSTKKLMVWLNAEKIKVKRDSNYKGTMKFYVDLKK